ncbi:MAG TPA: TetR/AcrR family transcriptional regulator [Bacillota bacterium]
MQYKKDEVKERIDKAALAVFSSKGYGNTKIADIAAKANVSVGNIYLYYKGKDDIFYSIVPESFWESLKSLLFNKIGMFREDLGNQIGSIMINRDFIKYLIENRERMLILFTGSDGTRYENIKEQLVNFLIATIKEHYFEEYRQQLEEERKGEVIIKKVYQNLLDLYFGLLKEEETIEGLQSDLKMINEYHLFGITGLLKIKNQGKLE